MNCFLAVCKDCPNNPNHFSYTIKELVDETGAIMSEDDGFIETSKPMTFPYTQNMDMGLDIIHVNNKFVVETLP